MKSKKTVSAAVMRKNQNNAKKSTGPTSTDGKNRSRFNAVKHGLTAKRIMFNSDGTPIDNGVAEIAAALREQYGSGNIVTELLIDNIVADYWRQEKGLAAEVQYLSSNQWAFHPQGSLATILRYNIANRGALLKNLEILQELHTDKDDAAGAPDGLPNENEENDTGAEEHEIAPMDQDLGPHIGECFANNAPLINDDSLSDAKSSDNTLHDAALEPRSDRLNQVSTSAAENDATNM